MARPFRLAAALAISMLGACGGGAAAGDAGAKAGAPGGGGAGAGASGVAGGGSGAGGTTAAGGARAGRWGARATPARRPTSAPTLAPPAIRPTRRGQAPLTQFLRIIQVTTVQGTQTVSISIDGQKNHNGAIHAAQALTMRIHVRPDTGWVAHPTVAELHLINPSMDVILVSAPRTITGASTAANLESTFNFDLTAAQVTKDLRFQVALRDPTGVPEDPPPAIQRALYPRDGTLDTLDAQ